MKNLRRSILLIFLMIVFAYVTNITAIPDHVVLFKGDCLNLGTIFGITVNEGEEEERAVAVVGTLNSLDRIETRTATLNLFNIFPVREIEVSRVPAARVIPLGNTVGIKLYSEGVLVVGMGEIEGNKPHLDSGIEEGDMIIGINERQITNSSELVETVNMYNGNTVSVTLLRDGAEKTVDITPAKTLSNEFKLGLWVRDGAVRNWYSNIL
ncbi:MAG: PDZ domain-containing protein [Oscillospiraceae bacterium]|nr:PDZ domain-containing protein [Oscillospiraceae bacterium]